MANPLLTTGLSNVLDKKVSSDIWDIAVQNSIVPTLGKTQPVIIGQNVIPTVTKRPVASMIPEGTAKKASDLSIDALPLYLGKAVVMTEVSLEVTLANPVDVLGIIRDSFGLALADQIDLAILHNRDAMSGAVVSADATAVNQTTQRVELGADVNATKREINAAAALVAGNSITPKGIAIDPKFVARMIDAVNPMGAELFPNISFGPVNSSVNGLRAAQGNTVSGVGNSGLTDTKVRAFVGDWDAVRWGKALEIGLKKVEYGNPTGAGDLQARNMVAYIGEVIFGWRVLDVNRSFAALEDKVA